MSQTKIANEKASCAYNLSISGGKDFFVQSSKRDDFHRRHSLPIDDADFYRKSSRIAPSLTLGAEHRSRGNLQYRIRNGIYELNNDTSEFQNDICAVDNDIDNGDNNIDEINENSIDYKDLKKNVDKSQNNQTSYITRDIDDSVYISKDPYDSSDSEADFIDDVGIQTDKIDNDLPMRAALVGLKKLEQCLPELHVLGDFVIPLMEKEVGKL